MKELFQRNIHIYVSYGLFLLFVGCVLLLFTKEHIHLWSNQYHSRGFDLFFKWITHFGDGLFAVFMVLLLLVFSFRRSIMMALSASLAGLLAQFGKRVVFGPVPRPKSFFEGLSELYFVPGVEVHAQYSFPSGHTASAFAVFMVLILMVHKPMAKWCLFIFAIIVAYSRIYLSQHFLVDIYFGSIIGVISATLSVAWIKGLRAEWMDKSIIGIFSKNV